MIVSRRSYLLSQTSPAIMRGAAMANRKAEADRMDALGHNEASRRFEELIVTSGAKP